MATRLGQLENCMNELGAAIKVLNNYCRDSNTFNNSAAGTTQPFVPSNAPHAAHKARGTIMANALKLQMLLAEPEETIQSLARQSQLLACMQWLGEFQVLACIPLDDSVPYVDVADLAGIPETQLRRIVRMTAAAGFLSEPQPDSIAHTALSAPFVTKPTFLDAAMFICKTITPAASQMAAATRRFGDSQEPKESAYNFAFDTPSTFLSAREQKPTLQRQWSSYLRCTSEDVDTGFVSLLKRFNWQSLGNACVVETGAQSIRMASSLADLYPALRFIVQLEPNSFSMLSTYTTSLQSTSAGSNISSSLLSSPLAPSPRAHSTRQQQVSSRIMPQKRSLGTPQTVKDAAIYILHLPPPTPSVSSHTFHGQIIAELRAHLDVLRTNHSTALILIPHLPEPGTVDTHIETVARMRDLSLMQLANDHEMEIMELTDMLSKVEDGTGRLTVVNKLRMENNGLIALHVRYQVHTDRRELGLLAESV